MYYLCSMNIKYEINKEQVRLILGGRKNQELFLWYMRLEWNLPVKINRKGVEVLDLSKIGDVTECIVENWEYVSCRDMLRNMFVLSDKYKRGRDAKELFNYYRDKYSYGDYNFPFVSNNFDDYLVKNVVYPSVGDVDKFESSLDKVKQDIEKFTYLKIFNTLRNDYMEYLIFGSSIDVIPTFSHRGGIDFYINGIGFDQKVSRSVTNQFKKQYGDDWRDVAIENPYEVCRYLMMYGDESRFSNVPRLFIVDIDGNYELDGIEGIVRDINFDSPRDVDYVYNHKSTGEKSYSCPVICILLYR